MTSFILRGWRGYQPINYLGKSSGPVFRIRLLQLSSVFRLTSLFATHIPSVVILKVASLLKEQLSLCLIIQLVLLCSSISVHNQKCSERIQYYHGRDYLGGYEMVHQPHVATVKAIHSVD